MVVLLSPSIVLNYQAAHAVPTLVQGSGTASPPLTNSGDFRCTSHHGPVDLVTFELYFIASVNGKSLSGVWAIGQTDVTLGDFLVDEEHGLINGGTIGSKVFNLTGSETFGNICSGIPASNIVNINGPIPSDCTPVGNRNVTVQFKDAKGQSGSFLTEMRCNERK